MFENAMTGKGVNRFDQAEFGAHRAAHVAQMRAKIATYQPGELTDAEREDLLLMREEEKIARDVYVRLHERWGLRPFANISGSEQAHMDMMLALLEHYGLPDPAHDLQPGKFHKAALQKLHDDLVEKGLQSQENAVQIGLLIEELDIADLQKALAHTAKPEIRAVYAELERGSRNHMRAFYRWKQHMGIDYRAAHLPQDELVRIALSAHETCS
ncbi:DUF2202 domain-containing protein [Acidocella aromatica]|uniref:DUF2202 domain-containing protein n=1 Tax=Acidocella aromatica TaxID=1303579 RepID=A0A840VMI4_9PROT|nr:DUF2202 domain-containing protein [Acidocella aromatica]MBB5373389.1 hypothetical protein [Acidocella aromatica]